MRRGFVIVWTILAIVVLTLGAGAWWIFSPSHAYYIRYTGSDPVMLVNDSPEVRRLIALEEAHASDEVASGEALLRKYEPYVIVERREHPERYFPEHIRFLDALTHQASVVAPAGSYARLLEKSHAKCYSDPSLSGEFAKVRLTSGPLRGQEGWLCEWRDLTPTILMDSSIPRFDRPRSDNDVNVVTANVNTRMIHQAYIMISSWFFDDFFMPFRIFLLKPDVHPVDPL